MAPRTKSGTRAAMNGATNPYCSAIAEAKSPANTATKPLPVVAMENVSERSEASKPRLWCSHTIHASSTENSSDVATPESKRPNIRIQKSGNILVTPAAK
eukprot:Amastigsp_a841276_152.p2 type:complete len:100 gc:universal Amastigsp_a841276_152:726-1025(+)